jgi:predicted RNA-binding Zn-ribbon protein involved in translation (DUF1610 family)
MNQTLQEQQRQCRDCGNTFQIAEREVTFYVQRGLILPKRCSACRALKRQHQTATAEGRA